MKSILQWCVRLKFSVSSTGQALDQAQDHGSEVISFEGGDKFLTADPTPNRMDCSGDSAVLHWLFCQRRINQSFAEAIGRNLQIRIFCHSLFYFFHCYFLWLFRGNSMDTVTHEQNVICSNFNYCSISRPWLVVSYSQVSWWAPGQRQRRDQRNKGIALFWESKFLSYPIDLE